MPGGQIGKASRSGREDSRFEPWPGSNSKHKTKINPPNKAVLFF